MWCGARLMQDEGSGPGDQDSVQYVGQGSGEGLEGRLVTGCSPQPGRMPWGRGGASPGP